MMIDKSVFSAEELAQYNALIAKAVVDPEAGQEAMEQEMPPAPKKKPATDAPQEEEIPEDTMKSSDPALTAALSRLETLEKSIAMQKYTEIAKKYAPLGEDEEALAKTLYDMEKSNQANYNTYINTLDKSLALVEKSGLFAEIGKSASGGPSTVEGKIEAKADAIMKAAPTMSRAEAVAKAWQESHELFMEYDAAYHQ